MYDSFANPVDPIAEHKLQGALNVIKQLRELAQRYQKLAPAERSAAAIEGLRHDADENDVVLSAYIMQADPQARDQVRAAYADQQSLLHVNEQNRMNYMDPDPEMRAFGKAKAEDRFDRMFEQTRPSLDRPDVVQPKKSVTFADEVQNVVKPKKSVAFADEVQNKVNPSVGSKDGTQPTVEQRGDFQGATKKTPPVPPDQSLKPSNRNAPTAPANSTFGGPGFGARKPDVPAQKPTQSTQPLTASTSAKRVADESAFAQKTVGSKVQQLQQKLNLQPKKLTNSHQ